MSTSIDAAALTALSGRLGDRGPDLARTLVATWRTETAARLADLTAAAATDDPSAAARAVHAVKSGSAVLGAVRLSQRCADLERALRDGRAVDLVAATAEVGALVVEADTGLAGVLAELLGR